MVYSNYKKTRQELRLFIINEIKKNNLSLYGSFETGSFHLDPNTLKTFSDIDTINTSMTCVQKNIISSKISKNIYNKFGIELPINIRNKRIHSDNLDDQISHRVSLLETLIKLIENNYNHKFTHYQIAKVYLRIIYRNLYFKKNITYIITHDFSKLFCKAYHTKIYGGVLSSGDIKNILREISNKFRVEHSEYIYSLLNNNNISKINESLIINLIPISNYKNLHDDLLTKLLKAKKVNKSIKPTCEHARFLEVDSSMCHA